MKILSVPLAIIVLIVFLVMDMGPDVTRTAQNCIAVFFCFLILWIFEPIPMALSCALSMPVAAIFSVATSAEFMSAGINNTLITMLCSFVLAGAMVDSHLGKRITLFIISHFGFSTIGISLGIVVVNLLLNFTTSSMVGRYVILAPIVVSLIDACKNQDAPESSNFAKNLMLTMVITNLTLTVCTYSAFPLIAQLMGMLQNYGYEGLDYAEYFKACFPLSLAVTMAAWAIIQIIYRPKKGDIGNVTDRNLLRNQLAELGRMTSSEWKAAIVTIGAILGWIFGERVGLDIPNVTIIACVILTLPKVGMFTWKDWLDKIGWSMVFIVLGSVAMGSLLYQTGGAEVIGNFLYTALGIGNMSIGMGLLVFLIVINFMHVLFVGTGPYLAAIVPIAMGLSEKAGWNPGMIGVATIFLCAAGSFILFCSNNSTLMSVSTGKVEANDYVKAGTPILIAGAVIVWAAIMYYWPSLGIF